MSNVNVKPSGEYPVKDQILPQSMAAAATATSGWVSAAEVKWAKVLALIGAGAGTIDVKLEQAKSSGGANAKDLATAAVLGIVALATAAKSAQADFSVADGIDVDNLYTHIRLSATCTGGSGTLFSCSLEVGPAYRQA